MLETPIELVEKGEGKFVGWQLENDGRFLLEDFTVVHNTPEGQPVGIVKNFAITTDVSNRVSSFNVKNILNGLKIAGVCVDIGQIPILLNGRVYKYTNDALKSVEFLRGVRTIGIIPPSISISFSRLNKEVRIYSDEGRMLRPLLVLPEAMEIDWSKKPSFKDLVEEDVIRYLDPCEIEDSVIAMTPMEVQEGIHTYLELHPVCMLGAVGVCIPYPDHNQAPRVCYYSSMNKQTIGFYANNNHQRTDTTVHTLDYVQKAIVSTEIGDAINNSNMPSGINCIVAIMAAGVNQEDCIILNRSAIDRGLFVSHTFRTVTVEEKRMDGNTSSRICFPDKQYQKPAYNYNKLDKNGIIRKGVQVNVGDVLVGKLLKKKNKADIEVGDASIVVCMKEEGIIDSIFETTNPEGYRIIKIKVRTIKIPELGDKFASRSAQKGTLGMSYRSQDMPFTSDGIVPDIILNPAAMPSRMTISQLLECRQPSLQVKQALVQ